LSDLALNITESQIEAAENAVTISPGKSSFVLKAQFNDYLLTHADLMPLDTATKEKILALIKGHNPKTKTPPRKRHGLKLFSLFRQKCAKELWSKNQVEIQKCEDKVVSEFVKN
ncbi:MAG: hypothetical protein ACXVLQ_16755, partial [Bacteriovorax sp.]